MTKAGHTIKVEIRTGTIRTSVVGTMLEMIVIDVNIMEVIEETSMIETGHMTEVKT